MLKLNSFEEIYEPGLGGERGADLNFVPNLLGFFFYSCLGSVFRPLNNATYFMILIWKEYNIMYSYLESFMQYECFLPPAQLLDVKVLIFPPPSFSLLNITSNSILMPQKGGEDPSTNEWQWWSFWNFLTKLAFLKHNFCFVQNCTFNLLWKEYSLII